MKHADFGSVISGTLRTEDLLDSFAWELEHHLRENPESFSGAEKDRLAKMIKKARKEGAAKDEFADELVNNLADELQAFAPDYGYFGAHPGDGADFGFWLSEDWERAAKDDDALFVSDLAEVPDDASGPVVVVNDHGNVTLYYAEEGKLTEQWSCV